MNAQEYILAMLSQASSFVESRSFGEHEIAEAIDRTGEALKKLKGMKEFRESGIFSIGAEPPTGPALPYEEVS